MPYLVVYGVIVLTAAVLSGWAMVLILDRGRAKRLGIVAPHRIRQAHIELLMMGTILVAIGAAVPDPPIVFMALMSISAWVAPLNFVPVAFKPEWGEKAGYKLVDQWIFWSLSVSFVWLAADVVSRSL
jgi:hydroxylaminobenzene mutase